MAVVDGHASTLANLLTNGALQRHDTAVEVRGHAVNDWFYELVLRDHGVAPEERAQAIAKIKSSLSLASPAEERALEPHEPRAYRGYGVALMMARVLVVRYGGHLTASAPASGRGVEFHLVLPRVPPAQIPPGANHPEALA